MMGTKDGKGDGANHRGLTGSGAGANGVETGALFPRLHVKETKRVGPRAPPRNKMALYEQFTFPSYRFVPPAVMLPTSGLSAGSSPYSPHVHSNGEKMALYEQFTFPQHRLVQPSTSFPSSGLPSRSCSSSLQQSSSNDGSRYYCPPPYGSLGMPYMAMNVPHQAGQPVVNGSATSTVVDSESEIQRTPSTTATASGGVSSHGVGFGSFRPSSHANLRTSSSKKGGRINDDCTVPIYTAPKSSTGFPKVYSEGSDWSSGGPWQPGIDLTKACQPMPVSYDYQVNSSGPSNSRGDCREESVTGVTGEHRETKIVYSERGVGEVTELPDGTSREAYKEKQVSSLRNRHSHFSAFRVRGADTCDQPHRRKNSQYFDDTSEADGLRSCGTGNGECLTVLEDDEDSASKHRKSSTKTRATKDSEVSDSRRDQPQPASQGLGKKEKKLETEKARKPSMSTECRSNTPGSSDDNVENPSDCEVSEHTQPALWSDSEESDATMLEADPSHKITPKDLINAVGQQEFWTARKILQRQQMIFASQVFELHCLIKVQQLLVGEDEEDWEEDDQQATPSPPEVVPEKLQGKKTGAEKPSARPGVEDLESKGPLQQPDSTCQSSTSKRAFYQTCTPDPQPGVESGPAIPVVPSAGTSGTSGAWGYPPYAKSGANGWFGALPAVNGAYMYQPYPGPYPQPQAHSMGAFNGSYRPVICAPTPMDVSGMSTYGMPGYEQRPDLMQDMYRYNTLHQQWQAAMYCNSVAQDPNASWYSTPPLPYMDPSRMPMRWYDEMASSHSSAHPGFHRQPHQSSGPSLPTDQPMVYPMHPQWPEAVSGQVQGREGDRFRAQASWPLQGRSAEQGFQRPVTYPAQEVGAPGSQVAEGRWGNGWEASEGKSPQDSNGRAVEVPAASQYSTGEVPDSRVHKRGRETVPEARSPADRDRQRNSVEETNSGDQRRDALPLFPLATSANAGEKQKSSSHSFPGVIKVVPRAMVATAESAAEILLSIQKQRQQ
ncbi:protein EARLY FLOWERING 3 [Marchantia polymorpha subsp. ruderalis]